MKRCLNGKYKKDGQGKLFSKYYNLRKSLKKVGLLNEEQVAEGMPVLNKTYFNIVLSDDVFKVP